MTKSIPLYVAVLGGKVEVDTPDGAVALAVPAGSNTGTVLRLKGKGVRHPTAPGHLFVKLQIVLDNPQDPELAAFLRRRAGG